LQPSTRGTWGSSPTRSCGSTFSRRSILPRRRTRRECGEWCTLEAAPSRCGRVEVSCTYRRSSPHRTAGGMTTSSTCTTTMADCLSSLARS
jgi:hypothetical protein